jgi:hypothetical protein
MGIIGGMKMNIRAILLIVAVIVVLKFLFALLFFLLTPVFLVLIGLGVLVKKGLFTKLFSRKKSQNGDVVIEVKPIKMD